MVLRAVGSLRQERCDAPVSVAKELPPQPYAITCDLPEDGRSGRIAMVTGELDWL